MFYLEYRVMPTDAHPHATVLIDGLAAGWVDRPTLDEARAFMHAEIAEQQYEILGEDVAEEVTPEVYADPEAAEELAYYNQALEDGEVLVYHDVLKYPVYWIVVEVEREDNPEERGQAHYFIAHDCLTEDEEAVWAPDFWSGEIAKQAREAAELAIRENGWNIVSVISEVPCGEDDVPEDLMSFWEESAEGEPCLIFAVEGEDGVGEDPDAEDETGEAGEIEAPK